MFESYNILMLNSLRPIMVVGFQFYLLDMVNHFVVTIFVKPTSSLYITSNLRMLFFEFEVM